MGISFKQAAIWSLPAVSGAGALLLWALALRDAPETARPVAAANRAAAPARGAHRLAQVTELARDPGASRERLIAFYGESAGDAAAVAARRLALSALFSQTNVALKLSSVLAAIEADPTPAERDPLWEELVNSLAAVWRGDALTSGIDLMAAESRPRAKRAVISSFAALAVSERLGELTPEQRMLLGNRFIDLFHSLPDGQKPEVVTAMRAAVSDDVADIALGKGLRGDNELEAQRRYNQARDEAPKEFAQAANTPATPLEPSPDYHGE